MQLLANQVLNKGGCYAKTQPSAPKLNCQDTLWPYYSVLSDVMALLVTSKGMIPLVELLLT